MTQFKKLPKFMLHQSKKLQKEKTRNKTEQVWTKSVSDGMIKIFKTILRLINNNHKRYIQINIALTLLDIIMIRT